MNPCQPISHPGAAPHRWLIATTGLALAVSPLLAGCLSPDARDWKNDLDTGEDGDTGADADCEPEDLTSDGIDFVRVCPGTFTMGSPSSEAGRV